MATSVSPKRRKIEGFHGEKQSFDPSIYKHLMMPAEDKKKYKRQCRESNGFDVDEFPNMGSMVGQIMPLQIKTDKTRNDLEEYCKLALQEFAKEEKNSEYQFVEVVKANSQPAAGLIYYITFIARSLLDQTCLQFQAKVFYKPFGVAKGTKVMLCRIKPTQ